MKKIFPPQPVYHQPKKITHEKYILLTLVGVSPTGMQRIKKQAYEKDTYTRV